MEGVQDQKDFRKVLDAVWEYLVDELELEPVLKELEAAKVFRRSVLRDIRERHFTTEKIRALLQSLRDGNCTGYAQFKRCLGDSGQQRLVDIIEKAENEPVVRKEPMTEEENLVGATGKVGQERYLRIILLLYDGGLFVTRRVITNELARTGESIDTVLNKVKSKLHHELGEQQFQKIFPKFGGANIEEWDLQLLTKVLSVAFYKQLDIDQRGYITQLGAIRNNIMHASRTVLDENDYTTNKDDIINCLRKLSSTDATAYQTCSELINRSLQDSLDTLSENFNALKYIREFAEKLTKNEDKIIERTSHIVKETEKMILEAVKELGNKKDIRVPVQAELSVDAHNDDTSNLIEEKLYNMLDDEDSEVQMPDRFDKIEQLLKELLDQFKQLKDVTYKGCKRKCILLFFECTSCEGLRNLLHLFHSESYQNTLTKLALALKQIFQLSCPVYMTSQIPPTAILKIAQELDIAHCISGTNSEKTPKSIDLLLTPKQNTELGVIVKEDNTPSSSRQDDTARGIQLHMECVSEEGIWNVLKLFEEDKISQNLQKLQDALTKHYGQEIKVKASVNTTELLDTLTQEDTDRGQKNVPVSPLLYR